MEPNTQPTFKELIAKANSVSLITILRNYGIKIDAANRKITCPFPKHKGGREHTPSFYYYPDTNSFWCFGCSTGRKCVDFVISMEETTITQATYKIINMYACEISSESMKQTEGINYSERLAILMDFSDNIRQAIQFNIDDPKEIKRIEELTLVFDKMNTKHTLDNIGLRNLVDKVKDKLNR